MHKRKSHLKVYRATVVECSNCGQIATYWSKSAILPRAEVTRLAEQAGWIGTPHGAYCPSCVKDNHVR